MRKESLSNIGNRFKCTALSFGMFLALLALWTGACYLLGLNNTIVAVGSYAIITVCIVAASFYNSFSSAGKGWLNGLIGGSLLLLAIFAFGLIVMKSDLDLLAFGKKCPLYLIVSMISGIIGINVK